MVGRCNFLGCDRPDAAKEASRWMANPCRVGYEKVVCIGQHPTGRYRRLVQLFPFGQDDGGTMADSDSDWAGCLRARMSTSGGVWCIGGCMIKHWPRAQTAIALSSAEAELNIATRALSEAKVSLCLVGGLGEDVHIRAHVYAQATIRLRHRAGLVKARHVETTGLWIQKA